MILNNKSGARSLKSILPQQADMVHDQCYYMVTSDNAS